MGYEDKSQIRRVTTQKVNRRPISKLLKTESKSIRKFKNSKKYRQ